MVGIGRGEVCNQWLGGQLQGIVRTGSVWGEGYWENINDLDQIFH